MTNFGGNQRIHTSKDISLTETYLSKKRGGDDKGKATEESRGKWSKVYSIDEKAEKTLVEIVKRYKLTADELADVGRAIKEVGSQLADVGGAVKGKARKGRKKKEVK